MADRRREEQKHPHPAKISDSTVVQVIDFSTASNRQPLHPLGAEVRRFIYDQIQAAATNPHVAAIVLTGGKINFSTGADVTEFAGWIHNILQQQNNTTCTTTSLPECSPSSSSSLPQEDAPPLNVVIAAMEACPKPVVAAMAGMALGGGLELALACHYRIAAADDDSSSNGTNKLTLGLPEVKIGLIPGAGGTQRLPRLIGLTQACPLILTGASVPGGAAAALKMGLVDDIVPASQLVPRAQQWAAWAASMAQASSAGPIEFLKRRLVGTRRVPEDPATVHNILHLAELAILPHNHRKNSDNSSEEDDHDDDGNNDGRLVVLRAAIRALRASATLPTLQEGLKVEEECFLEALTSPAGMAQRHVFFAVRQAQKAVHPVDVRSHVLLQKSTPKSPVLVQTAVIGAGTMGCGIVMVLLKAGFAVTLVDVQQSALDKGLQMIQQTLLRKSINGKTLQKNLHATTNLQDLSQCRLVVEAVVEKLQIKQSIFTTLSRVTPPDAILLSNTSTLDIDAMASVLPSERRAKFAGWHFFSPAHVMQLVEIVVGSDTSQHTIALLQALSKKVGKIAVVVGNCDGFCGNRLLRPYSLEMVSVLVEGAASIAQIDTAVADDLGMALGPFAMGDLAGNDIGYSIRVERQWARGGGPRGGDNTTTATPINRPARYSELADVMVTDYGRLGQKTGKGWYDYDPTIGKGRTPLPSAEMQALVERYITVLPALRRRLSSQEIIQRIIFPLINEGFKCLEEGIVQRPSDIDVVYIYGYGWPAWRGGPMYWADHDVGLPNLLQVLRMLSRQFPDTPHYVPSLLLEDCVARQLTVEEYYRPGLDKQHVKQKNKLPAARL